MVSQGDNVRRTYLGISNSVTVGILHTSNMYGKTEIQITTCDIDSVYHGTIYQQVSTWM
jgi:hypothetical protein